MSNVSYPTPLITFEGIDLCGKSVQIKRLEEKLVARNIPYLLLREPGGTIFSEPKKMKP